MTICTDLLKWSLVDVRGYWESLSTENAHEPSCMVNQEGHENM